MSGAEQDRSGRREATLYSPLDGAGAGRERAGDGAWSAEQAVELLGRLREQALDASEHSDLPVWRRSGFWTTSFAALQWRALAARHHQVGADGQLLDPSARELAEGMLERLPQRRRAGRIVQLDGSVIACELDQELAGSGVQLCALEDAPALQPQIFAHHYAQRLPANRNKLQAANAALWSGGVFLHVPRDCRVELPFEIVNLVSAAGVAQHSRILIVGAPGSDFRVHEFGFGASFSGQALHTEGFELYLAENARCHLASVEDWGPGEVFNATTRVVQVGRDAQCHWLPALLGGHLTHEHLELAIAAPGGETTFHGIFLADQAEQLDLFAVGLHEAGPSAGDMHFRGTAAGESRASLEGLIKINAGAQQSHTYLQLHTMMLSPAARLDAIPSVQVAADDVSASHGGTVGELDETAIFYMQSRGLDRSQAVRILVEGFFEPLLAELADEPLEALLRELIAGKLSRARADIDAYAASR